MALKRRLNVHFRRNQERALIVVANLPVPDDERVWRQALAAREAGYAVVVVCPGLRGHRAGRRVIEDIEVWYFPSFEGSSGFSTVLEGIWTTLACTVLGAIGLRGNGYAQVCNPPDSWAMLLGVARARGAWVVYDQHDVVPLLAAEKGLPKLLLAVFDRLESATVSLAHSVVVPSVAQRRRMSERYRREATLVRTPAPELQAPEGREFSEGIRYGYLGVIGGQDGVPDLIRAFGLAAPKMAASAKLLVAGDGPGMPDVRKEVYRQRLERDVTFYGWLSGRNRVASFLAGIDVMVVPDPLTDFNHLCAMNKVTHAMAAGIPVIMRPLEENSSMAGEHGLIAWDGSVDALADELVSFSRMTIEQRAAVGRALQSRWRSEFDWEVHKKAYLKAVADRRHR